VTDSRRKRYCWVGSCVPHSGSLEVTNRRGKYLAKPVSSPCKNQLGGKLVSQELVFSLSPNPCDSLTYPRAQLKMTAT
jgi:hypothetical protein